MPRGHSIKEEKLTRRQEIKEETPVARRDQGQVYEIRSSDLWHLIVSREPCGRWGVGFEMANSEGVRFKEIWGPILWYFWLTIQNTANRQVRNKFCLLAVFISFSLARCAPPPHSAPFYGEGKVPKKTKKQENRCRWRGSGEMYLESIGPVL
jgi:hypothetical protein